MINQHLHHPQSNTTGTVDSEVIHPDGQAMVRICDKWVLARDCRALEKD